MKRKIARFIVLGLSLCAVFGCLLIGCTPKDSPVPSDSPSQESAIKEATEVQGMAASEKTSSPNDEISTGGSSEIQPGASDQGTDLIVFAAASLTETLTEIADKYKDTAPDVSIVFNFDSSGTLKSQIENGADCDLFISAAPKQMNQLDNSKDGEANPDGLDFVLQGTRIDLLENKVVLAVPEGNPSSVESFDNLADRLNKEEVLLAMGNSDVPVGQYTQKILAFYSLSEQALADAGTITYGSNVKEVTSQVMENAADCGIIYSTDAFSAGLSIVDTATEEMCGRVIYPAAVLKTAKDEEAAKAFLQFLSGAEAKEIFESVGFSVLS